MYLHKSCYGCPENHLAGPRVWCGMDGGTYKLLDIPAPLGSTCVRMKWASCAELSDPVGLDGKFPASLFSHIS